MEDIFNKDITVINKYFNKEKRKNEYKVSYVKGFWSSNDGISINGTQLTKADGLTARILINTPSSQGGIRDIYNFKLARAKRF